MNTDGLVCNIKPILMFRCLLGYYYNFSSTTCKSYLVKMCIMTVSLIIVILNILYYIVLRQSYYGIFTKIVQYCVYIALSIYTGENYLLNYYKFDVLLDDEKQLKLYDKLRKFLLLFTFNSIFFDLVFYTILHEIVNERYPVISIFHVLLYIGNNLGRLLIVMIFGLLYCRTKLFCNKVRSEISLNPNVLEWRKFMSIYVHYLNSLKKTDYPIKLMVFAHVTISLVDIVNLQYRTFSDLKLNKMVMGVASFLPKMTILSVPIVIMEMSASELDRLKIDVVNRMLSISDMRLRAEYRLFLDALREQSLNYVALRVLPLRLNALFRLLSLALTYLICLLQFSNKYNV